MISCIHSIVTLSAILPLAVAAAAAAGDLEKDERSGLYYEPDAEITLGTTDGDTYTGRVKDIYRGEVIFENTGGGESVIALHQLDESAREYFLSLEPAFDIKSGSFTMKTPFPRNGEIEVHYQIPMRDGTPAPGAANLVYYAPYRNEKGGLRRDLHRRLTRDLGLSLFSFRIATTNAALDRAETNYSFKESGWPRFVFDVQKRVLEETGLPYRKLLVMGESVGATMAAHLAIHYPQWVEAVAFVGGGRLDEPTPECASVKWFVCHTIEDRLAGENRDLVESLRDQGNFVLYSMFPAIWRLRGKSVHFHHAPNKSARFAMVDFLADVAAARGPGGEPSNPEAWTVVPETQAADDEPALANHPLVGTWGQALPGERTAAHAGSRLLPLRAELVEGTTGQVPVLLAEPTEGEPAAIVVYAPAPEAGSPDPLYFLAEQGLVGAGLELPEDPKRAASEIRRVREWLTGIDEWKHLPLYYVGDATTRPALRSLAADGFSRDHGVFLITPEAARPGGPGCGTRRTPLFALDVRPDADKRSLDGDHPFHGSPLESSRWVKIPGGGEADKGKRWVALWETIADLSR